MIYGLRCKRQYIYPIVVALLAFSMCSASVAEAAPAITLSSPAASSAVSGSATIACAVNSKVVWVNFYIDGGYLTSAPPFIIDWNSRSVSNGSHTISVTAYGSNNAVLGSSSVTVNVNNGPLGYYVSSSSGSDSNTGTDSSHPWQTLGKVVTILPSLSPGQWVLFKRGDSWTASGSAPMISLPFPLTGTSAAPIVFSNYGTGALPVFDGGSTSTGCFQQRAVGIGSVPLWSYITIDGFECRNTTQYGVLFYQNAGGNVGMPGIVVQNMNIHNTGPGAYARAIQGRTSTANGTCTN
jgi:hypothetical protein